MQTRPDGSRGAHPYRASEASPGGAWAVEVTVVFDDDVVQVRQLRARRDCRWAWALAVAGACTMLAGIGWALVGQVGVGALLALAGLAATTYARGRRREANEPTDFVVGDDPAADLPLSSSDGAAGSFCLVRHDGTQQLLRLAPGWRGEVYLRGRRQFVSESFDDDAQPSGVCQPTGLRELPLVPDTSARIVFGRQVVWVRVVEAAGEPLRGSLWGRIDWPAQLHNGVSFLGHALLLGLVFALPPDAKALSLDLFELDKESLRYLVRPVRPQPLIAPPQPDAGGGGVKAPAGKPGKMGNPQARQHNERFAVPKQGELPKQLAREYARASARRAGALGVLSSQRGGILTSLLGGDSAIGDEAEEALGSLMGVEIGEARGVGGLSPDGDGRHGCGDHCGDYVGVGQLARIGTGRGPGNGPGIHDGFPDRLKPNPGPPPPPGGVARIDGRLDRSLIRRVIRLHLNEVRHCYQKELRANVDLYGRVVVVFTIAANGRVLRSAIDSKGSTLGSPPVERCLTKAVRRWQFPQPKNGGLVHVHYPFVFRESGSTPG